jgi:hypothetical protein
MASTAAGPSARCKRRISAMVLARVVLFNMVMIDLGAE